MPERGGNCMIGITGTTDAYIVLTMVMDGSPFYNYMINYTSILLFMDNWLSFLYV